MARGSGSGKPSIGDPAARSKNNHPVQPQRGSGSRKLELSNQRCQDLGDKPPGPAAGQSAPLPVAQPQ